MINIGNKHLGQDDDDEAVEFAECYTVVYEKENGSRVSHNGISLLSKLSVLRSAITKLAVLSMADGVGGIFFGNSADDKSSEEDSDEYYDEGSDAHLIAQSWCDLKASICSVIYLESSSGCAHKKNESSDLMGIKESFRHCLSVGHSTNDFSNPILEVIYCINKSVAKVYNAFFDSVGELGKSNDCTNSRIENDLSKIIKSCDDYGSIHKDITSKYCPSIYEYMEDKDSSVDETTVGSITLRPTTPGLTTREATTFASTTLGLTTQESTTLGSTTLGLTTQESTTLGSTTLGLTTQESTTFGSTTTVLTSELTTLEPITTDLAVIESVTLDPVIDESIATNYFMIGMCMVFLFLAVTALIFLLVRYRVRNNRRRYTPGRVVDIENGRDICPETYELQQKEEEEIIDVMEV